MDGDSPAQRGRPLTFIPNGTNAGRTADHFQRGGNYTFQVTITDPGGLTVTSSVNVTVNLTLTSTTISPPSAVLSAGAAQQFTATENDQFGNALTTQPTWTWSVIAGSGVISNGLYMPPDACGSATVQAVSGAQQSRRSDLLGAAPWSPRQWRFLEHQRGLGQ